MRVVLASRRAGREVVPRQADHERDPQEVRHDRLREHRFRRCSGLTHCNGKEDNAMITNGTVLNVQMRRIDLLDAILAIDSVIVDFKREIKNPETTATRREICQSAVDRRWEPLRQLLRQQLDAADAEGEADV